MNSRGPITSSFEAATHHQLISGLIGQGRPPSMREVANSLAMSVEQVEETLRRLADTHGIVLHPHKCEPWVVHPFSVSPTATWLQSGERGWWCPCMWCACGAANLVGGNAVIHTRLGGEAEDIDIHIHDGRVQETDLWVHFAVPSRDAWSNVHHFCATVLPFRDPNTAKRWSERHRIALGAVIPISQVVDLGTQWYARHADPDWQKWSLRQAAEIFRSVGLTGDFWEIPGGEGGF